MQIVHGYIDYKMVGEKYMHVCDWKKLVENICSDIGTNFDVVVLITCLRFELFIGSDAEYVVDVLKKYELKVLSKPYDIFYRFLRIACGLESTIIGESAIFNQMLRSVKNGIYPKQTLSDALNRCLKCAFKIRKDHNLFSPHSYATIGAELLLKDHPIPYTGLTLIGAGSMGENFLQFMKNNYQIYLKKPVYIVNRTLRSAKKIAKRNKIPNYKAFRLDKINSAVNCSSHIFIATGGELKIDYELHKNFSRHSIVDISFPAVFEMSDTTFYDYRTALHPDFHDKFELCNRAVLDKYRTVSNEIKKLPIDFYEKI